MQMKPFFGQKKTVKEGIGTAPLKKEPSELGENWKTDIAGLVAKWLTKRHRHLIRQVLVSESVFLALYM